MNTHLLSFFTFLALVGLNMFCGWQMPDLVVASPLIVIGIYILADLWFMFRKVYQANKKMNVEAILGAGAETQATVELAKTRNKLAKQRLQHAKHGTKGEERNDEAGNS